MKAAFVGLQIEADNLKEWIAQYCDETVEEDVQFHDSAWNALAYLGGAEKAFLGVPKNSLDENIRNVISNLHLVLREVKPVEKLESYDQFQHWINDEDGPLPTLESSQPVTETTETVQEEEVNPMESVLNSDEWRAETATLESTSDSTGDDEVDLALLGDDNEVPQTPETSGAGNEPSNYVTNYAEVPPQGLNSKITVTPDMLAQRKRQEHEGGRVPYDPSDKGYLMLVTSGFGGGGKTTCAYYSAQVTGMALRHSNNDKTKVFLIEGDYDNPKLQNRLKIAPGKDLATLANFLEEVNLGKITGTKEEIAKRAEEIIYEITFDDPNSDVKIIVCPYDSSRAKPAYIKEALKKAVLWAQRTMGYFVVLDCDTIGLPEGIELDLVEMANRILVISNTRELEVKKSVLPWAKETRESGNPNDRSHIDDALIMIRKLTRDLDANGFGVPGDRIRVFFNETSAKELKSKVLDKRIFPDNMVIGNLEYIKEIDRAWAGDLGDNRNKSIEVAKTMTNLMYRATHKNEFDRLAQAMNAR